MENHEEYTHECDNCGNQYNLFPKNPFPHTVLITFLIFAIAINIILYFVYGFINSSIMIASLGFAGGFIYLILSFDILYKPTGKVEVRNVKLLDETSESKEYFVFFQKKSVLLNELRYTTSYASSNDKLFETLKKIHKKAGKLDLTAFGETVMLLENNKDKIGNNSQ